MASVSLINIHECVFRGGLFYSMYIMHVSGPGLTRYNREGWEE